MADEATKLSEVAQDTSQLIHSASEKTANIRVEVLPKKLDEEVAAAMVIGFGGVVTQLTQVQADYLGVAVEGPFKTDAYKY